MLLIRPNLDCTCVSRDLYKPVQGPQAIFDAILLVDSLPPRLESQHAGDGEGGDAENQGSQDPPDPSGVRTHHRHAEDALKGACQ